METDKKIQKQRRQIEKQRKQIAYFSRTLHQRLKQFEKFRQWADINQWLQYLQKFLLNKHYKDLPHSVLLAKRLAQCLNNNLPPGVHEQALKVYELILTNFQQQQTIKPLMSIGLFPFFEISSSKLKFQLLKIYQNFFLNNQGCLQMMISLMNSLLTGLNQNNQELVKRIFQLCQKISKEYGYIWADGAVWVNILKSSKVKIAGFKYFMKVFKDRDKQKANKEQQKNLKQKNKQQGGQVLKESIVRERNTSLSKKSNIKFENGYLKSSERDFLKNLIQEKDKQDGHRNRYPNFSTLVVNAIRSCLQPQIESLAKRAALEHVSTYLKLSQNSIISQNQALILVSSMLRVLTQKQFSLTRRIYFYLFDQPNSQGHYIIDPQVRKYQLNILICSLKKMLKQDDYEFLSGNRKNFKSVESTLSIIQILIKDHPKLAHIMLPRLSYDILRFLKTNFFQQNNSIVRQLKKKILQFNQNAIAPHRMIFLQAILIRVQKKQQKQKIVQQQEQEIVYSKQTQNQFIQVINILDFYIYTLYKAKYQLGSNHKGSIKKSTSSNQDDQNSTNGQITQQLKQICLTTLDKILYFLKISKLRYEKLSCQALDFANKINNQTLLKCKRFQLSQSFTEKINQLIEMRPNNSIYARLITLHPTPKKQILLPFIDQGAFAIIFIKNLLPTNSTHKVDLTEEQQIQIFYAIFKLLQCHLWQEQAFQFLNIFIKKYEKTFGEQIDRVDASQWLIYWRLAQGDVKGGVIRMILNAQSQNPLKKNMSCKWIQANQHIISKIIEPIFLKLNRCLQKYQNQQFSQQTQRQIQQIYNLIKIVFDASNQSFQRYFFLQKQKYLNRLLEIIFLNLQLGNRKLKTKSMDMMKYVLFKTSQYQQKHSYIYLTLPRILSIFKTLITKKHRNLDNQDNNVIQSKELNLNRISSIDKEETEFYLQQIEIVQYFASLNVCIRKSLKDKQFKSQEIIQLFQNNGLYLQVIRGLFQSDLSYVRTLYLDFLKDSCDLLAKTVGSKDFLSLLINLILEKIFLILKTQNITSIQATIRQKKQNNPKNSIHRTRRLSSADLSQDLQIQKLVNQTLDTSNSFYIAQQNISKNDINIQAKYSQIIQMWNSVKFYTKFSIQKGILNLPIVNLLSLILQSFPFSYLKYTQMIINQPNQQSEGAISNYELLQQEINKVTGLKKQVLQIIDIIWSKYNIEISQFLIERGDPRILIHCTIDPIEVLKTINKNPKFLQVNKYYTKSIKLNLPRNVLHYSGLNLMKQNQICYFLYLYLMYCNFGLIKNKKLSSFLEELLNIINVLRLSQHIQIKIWIFELIHLLSQRILLSKEIYIEGGTRIKQQLQIIAKQMLDQLIKSITKSKSFTYKSEIKTGLIANIFSKQEKQAVTYDFIKMNPPTIFVMSLNYARRHKKRNAKINSKDKKQSEQKMFINYQNEKIEYFLFQKWLNLSQHAYQDYLAICCLKTLIAISCPLIINIFQKDLNKINAIIKQIILSLLPVCEDKNDENIFRVELISEYIYSILHNKLLKKQVLPLTRRNIIAIFMGNAFFKTTKRTLYYWKGIIDCCTESQANTNYDLLGELLTREAGLFEGLLKGRQQVLRQKIKSFERICFVIYSGKIDKYQGKLNTVLSFLNEVMKEQNPPPALLILMFFCIRILFMRLSQTSLFKMFKSIWPGLISMLITIFNSKQKKKNKNINLILAALKVVELIHALEIEQFNFHKWIFIIDYFGIKVQSLPGELTFKQTQTQILTPFIFKPYLTNLLPSHVYKCQFLPCESTQTRQTVRPQKQKRKIIIKYANIQTIQQLQNLAQILMQYMIDCNQKRIEVSKTQIQQLIEADFITLDDYIFQVR